MRRTFVLAAVLIGLSVGCAASGGRVEEPYRGFKADVERMRETTVLSGGGGGQEPIRASTGEAVGAARRVFERTPLLFRQRSEVLALLGDPSLVSDYNRPAATDGSEPLVYRFDTGFNGFQVTINFEPDGMTREVEVDVLE